MGPLAVVTVVMLTISQLTLPARAQEAQLCGVPQRAAASRVSVSAWYLGGHRHGDISISIRY